MQKAGVFLGLGAATISWFNVYNPDKCRVEAGEKRKWRVWGEGKNVQKN